MRFIAGLVLTLAVAFSGAAKAQYPDRPIKLIVPQAAGSNTDLYARLVGAEMSKTLGQQIIIENRPGAAFVVGLDAIAKSPPDGYTIGMGLIGGMAISPHMVAKLPYDVERDFLPVALVSRGYLILAVSQQLPVNSVAELIDYAKKNPGKLSNASSSNGAPGHVAGELFKTMTGTQITHVPYRGGSLAVNDLIAGHVNLMFEGLQSMGPSAREGKVRGLGISATKRLPSLPNLPPISETVPGYEAATWNGIIAPARTPPEIVARLNRAVNEARKSSLVIERFGLNGDEAGGGTPEQFAALIRADFVKWKDVVERTGVKLE